MAKKALLVGCNYPGTEFQLRGAVNDVKNVKNLLIKHYGFKEQDCIVLLDTHFGFMKPTGYNIRNYLKKLIKESHDGDQLYFHFSGHGVQVEDTDGDEVIDGLDEALVPSDLNIITDDELRAIVSKLDPGTKFTMVCDCCHAGTMLDHPEVSIQGPKQMDPIDEAETDDKTDVVLPQYDPEMSVIRGISVRSLVKFLAKRAGVTVGVGTITLTTALGLLHKSRVGKGVKAQLAKQKQKGGATGIAASLMDTAFDLACVRKDRGQMAKTVVTKFMSRDAQEKLAAAIKIPPPFDDEDDEESTEGSRVQVPDNSVLITACLEGEKGDEIVPQKRTKQLQPGGAFTTALIATHEKHRNAHPDKEISYNDLVYGVRGLMKRKGYAQSPCLECTKEYAQLPFITQAA